MAQLTRKRTALALYGVLLVLPTLVLGGLHWHQLEQDQQARLDAMPWEAYDAARRLSERVHDEVHRLIETENRRPFYHFNELYFPPGTVGSDFALVESPLQHELPPPGIVCWFNYDFNQGIDAPVELFRSSEDGAEEWRAMEADIYAAVADLIVHDWDDGVYQQITRFPAVSETYIRLSVAAINQSDEKDIQCMLGEKDELKQLEDEEIGVHVYAYHLRFYREVDGTPRILASRRVLLDGSSSLDTMPDCFSTLAHGQYLVQGFFIDPDWLVGELPLEAAELVLDGSQRFLPAGQPLLPEAPDEVVEVIRPIKELDFETYSLADQDFGAMQVAINTSDMQARFERQTRRFAGVAAMLLLSLATGLFLLIRSVRKDLEQAQQTENFVAAVTHELRTPVSAIRLYGEMLRDGWATAPEKRAEYYRRIVSEAERLETLVDRVLEKGQLVGLHAHPEPADLNACVEPVVEGLVQTSAGPADDLALELGSDLPPVMLTAEALSSIVVNLVENARKYAPVDGNGNGNGDVREPILVRTRRHRGRPTLEVLDRGPGIPNDQKGRIFEAFHRVGNESTRTSRGTGLGLHLVLTQAQALGGSAEVADRPGGGSIFRVAFRPARRA